MTPVVFWNSQFLNETQWGSSLGRMEAIESEGEKYSKYSTLPSPPSLPADHILLTADADVDKYQEHAFLMNLSICLNAHISFRFWDRDKAVEKYENQQINFISHPSFFSWQMWAEYLSQKRTLHIYDSFSDDPESRVWFASKNPTPCRMR